MSNSNKDIDRDSLLNTYWYLKRLGYFKIVSYREDRLFNGSWDVIWSIKIQNNRMKHRIGTFYLMNNCRSVSEREYNLGLIK
jgi:hypothetical protein